MCRGQETLLNMTPYFKRLSSKSLLQVTMGTRWETSTKQLKSIFPAKPRGSREHVLLLITLSIYRQTQIKRTSFRTPRNGLLQRDTSVGLSAAVLGHFCGVRYLWSLQLPAAQSLFCLASTMGEQGPAICAGNFKDVFWFTFCYNEVNANCFYVALKKFFYLTYFWKGETQENEQVPAVVQHGVGLTLRKNV